MINIAKGTQDLLPEVTSDWQYVENKLREIAQNYNYKEIRTPIFEHTELFTRGVGGSTDIVQKEMYTFTDKGDRSITLRPEGTAPVVRSYIENKMHGYANQPIKLFYEGPMFRYERKQKGRYRQFVQFGVEAIGAEDPAIDAEIIAMVMDIYQSFGLKKLKLYINSIGDIDSRSEYNKALVEHFKPSIEEFCSDCQQRIDTNPMRILDCKKDREHRLVKSAPRIYDYLNDDSKQYFEQVKLYLDQLGIDYEVDTNLVRGLDYYTHTAFEVMSDAEGFGAITTLCGGGRYNGLLEMLDGPNETGIGFALSIERLLLALEAEGIEIEHDDALDLFIATLDEDSKQYAVQLLHRLRKAGVKADTDYKSRKLKGQMKQADRERAKYTIVLGENEIKNQQVKLKDMNDGGEHVIELSSLTDELKERLS
ncbi:histidine--tRNA ligase [Abyssicoccus albus]|uniref:Histidine--tRNA ligase n=1 Tax=Abyssicoccus albus TaxID=1817405 RepID=A0A3N5BT00_9BACL|nr:histidine--tRNA ligase [Abyssicoccus albus]RPF58190.1 histidyl-tRNA synthetase [Abyssicoccus albus]